IGDLKSRLREAGAASAYQLPPIKERDLALERFRLVARLIKAAGYAGWVILIDEVELIGRYSILQRGKSYAELARLLGQAEGDSFPGIAVVATITNDFHVKVLGEKGDLDTIGPKLRSKGTDE